MQPSSRRRVNARETNLAEKYTAGQCTTVMIRNIPTEYTQDELIDEVAQVMGYPGLFDFFYLPFDSENDCNVGFCFVNFLDVPTATAAVKAFHDYRFRKHGSQKKATVLPAHIQGLENNLRHLKDRAVVLGNHPYSPVVMWKGRKVELSLIFQELRIQDTLSRFNGVHLTGQAPMPWQAEIAAASRSLPTLPPMAPAQLPLPAAPAMRLQSPNSWAGPPLPNFPVQVTPDIQQLLQALGPLSQVPGGLTGPFHSAQVNPLQQIQPPPIDPLVLASVTAALAASSAAAMTSVAPQALFPTGVAPTGFGGAAVPVGGAAVPIGGAALPIGGAALPIGGAAVPQRGATAPATRAPPPLHLAPTGASKLAVLGVTDLFEQDGEDSYDSPEDGSPLYGQRRIPPMTAPAAPTRVDTLTSRFGILGPPRSLSSRGVPPRLGTMPETPAGSAQMTPPQSLGMSESSSMEGPPGGTSGGSPTADAVDDFAPEEGDSQQEDTVEIAIHDAGFDAFEKFLAKFGNH